MMYVLNQHAYSETPLLHVGHNNPCISSRAEYIPCGLASQDRLDNRNPVVYDLQFKLQIFTMTKVISFQVSRLRLTKYAVECHEMKS